MTRRLLLPSLFLLATGLFADPLVFDVTINTTGLVGPGFIEFQYNQANAGTSLSSFARITQFSATGYVFDSPNDQWSSPAITGSLSALPVTIPNDDGAANYYDAAVTTFGTQFRFRVVLSGAAIGGSAPDGSGFYVFLFDSNFAPLVSGLPNGEVANLIVNPDGSVTPNGSVFDGGQSSVSLVPEPSYVLLSLSGLGLAGFLRKRRS